MKAKDIFVRKAEVNLSFLEKQAEDIKKIKGTLKTALRRYRWSLMEVREDMKELDKFHQMKQDLKNSSWSKEKMQN